MKRLMAATLMTSLSSIGMIGCSRTDNLSVKKETKIKGPEGTTTVTTETDVKTMGEKPPGKTL